MADKGLLDKIWEQSMIIQSKDNLITRLQAQLKELTESKGNVVVDKFVLEPSLIVMQL